MMLYHTPGGGTGYLYLPRGASGKDFRAPLVMMLCGTGHGPEEDAAGSGWTELAEQEGFFLMLPIYDNTAVFSNIDALTEAVTYLAGHNPVDESRIYTVGFSNGGATAAVLAAEKTLLFAGVSAMGWLTEPRRSAGKAIPFQLIQGSREYITRDGSGSRMVMRGERDAIRFLMEMNGILPGGGQPDYRQTPFWGWPPDSRQEKMLCGRRWTFSNYRKTGFSHPFMQLVMIEGAEHRTNRLEAKAAWHFLHPFYRGRDGRIYEDEQ